MREFEVLQLLATGKSNEDITEATFISAVLAFIGQSRDSALSCPD